MATTVPVTGEGNHDFEFAQRQLLMPAKDPFIHSQSGTVVWDTEAYNFLEADCPPEANKLLWRQGQLCSVTAGLYQVTNGIYQVRGFDVANMSIIQVPNTNNIVIVDCLTASEVASSAIQLYQDYHTSAFGKPATIIALLYTHCHVDHFGGAQAVVDAAGGSLRRIIAPYGFLEHAVSENVYAGPVMFRRSIYMYGQGLDKSPTGQIGCGLGQSAAMGTSSLVAPTQSITKDGVLEPAIEGLEIHCQLTPGTEAPAEVNFWFPGYSALCMAENATHTMHNIQTLRGAPVRDARLWSKYLDDAITLFGKDAAVVFSGHHWPTWKEEEDLVVQYLSQQRDMYAYIHNETLRHFNAGKTPVEIAEEVKLPASLASKTNLQGYYGSVSHNTKAIYDKYLGWFDGNPANLWPLPPVDEAIQLVKCMGGADNVLKLARKYHADRNLRFAASLLNKLVFAEPDNGKAKDELASVYKALGHGAENATWRNIYLTGAYELQAGPLPSDIGSTANFLKAMSLRQLFDFLAIQVDGPKASAEKGFTIEFLVEDLQQGSTKGCGWHLRLSNGVVTGREVTYIAPPKARDDTITLSVWLHHAVLVALVGSAVAGRPTDLSHCITSGDTAVWRVITSLLVLPNMSFNIVTP
ncbi:hypothetical protein HIM_09691 [Hirsutella minnesotensis 3608]|uniref:Metallo-beta-lactamase domain-containing protein n=1 Tax=Hirsutella minnesotensis 3608 TaxID=1043627 RepID=A0A0F7ZS80_9HYPO|nr:hypothetical protein HIM_09691 [Hirsutella minnesotensis 3608]